jgi:hypothetical protein
MTYMFMSKSQAVLMGVGYVFTWKLCPSIPTWKQYAPMPTQHPWAWVGLGMGMGMAPNVGLYLA